MLKLVDLGEISPRLNGSWAGAVVERLLGIDTLNACYDRACSGDGATPFLQRCLDVLEVRYRVEGVERLQTLRSGPCLVVANHPFGGIEAILFFHLLRQVRPDAKVIANYVLMRVPHVASGLIPVDPFARETSVRSNVQPMRRAFRHLQEGGVLGIFPSGTVSHWQLSQRAVTDPPWSSHVASLAQRTGAPILPIYFHGKNGWCFQLAGMIHPLFRTALLPREVLKKRGGSVQITVGKALSPGQLRRFEDPQWLTSFVRAATYLLREAGAGSHSTHHHRKAAPIPGPGDTALLAKEIAALPNQSLLLTKQGFEVYLLTRSQAPNVVLEIGRLREITFRDVGEGTGRAIDLDEFDDHYEHLILWSPQEQAIFGAYRLARADEVMAHRGLAGLYTASLYRFRSGFLRKLGGALELGRSFIVPRHQKQRYSLMLLWCGLGAFISRNPHYHTLFGPVSVSQNYTTLSKQLLVWFLKRAHRHPGLARLVRPNHPFKAQDKLSDQKALISDCIRSIDDVSTLISEFEEDGKGVPILFKQYLKVNALLLSFSVDQSFSSVLDGLVIADMRTADARVLRRYFGEEGLNRFLRYHRLGREI